MPRPVTFEGKTYSLPDGTTDQEALDFVSSQHPTATATATRPNSRLPMNLGHIYTPPLQDSGFFSENGFGPGTFGKGISEAIQPGKRLAGAHDMFVGAGEIASPAILPSLVAAPAATIGTLAAAGAGGAVGKVGSMIAGASPEVSDLVGDAGSVVGGGLASSPKIQAFTKGAIKAIPGAISEGGGYPTLYGILHGKTSLPAVLGTLAGHAFGHPYEGGALGVLGGAMPSAVRGGVTAAENAPWLPELFREPIVRPPAARFDPTPRPTPDATPIPAKETLTGRKPGGIQNQTAIEPIVRPPAAELTGIDPNDLDAAASLLTNNKKVFKDLTGAQRQTAINQARGFSQQRVALQSKQPLSQPLPQMTQSGSAPIATVQNAARLQQPVATTFMPDLESKVIAQPAIEPLASGAPMQPIAGNNINYPAHVHEQLHPAGPEVAITHGTNASAKDLAVAQRLKAAGITPQAMDAMTDDALNQHYTALGYKKLGSDFSPGKRVGRDAATGRAHLRRVLGEI